MNINILNTLLLLYNLKLVLCQNIFITTNYTLNTITKQEEIFNCKVDEDCIYGYCGFTEKGDICIYSNFLCIEDENKYCIFINETTWDIEDEKPKIANNNYKPILKTCEKEEIDNNTCETNKCENNDDCFSGLCYRNSCSTEKTIYRCSDNMHFNGTRISRRKNANMKCNSNDDCFDYCEKGFCRNYGGHGIYNVIDFFSIFAYISIFIVIVFLVIVGIIIFKKCKKGE
eukprot:jgi/Orpsp1_1/1177372/evm.model.c7180000061198.2